jgi:hypothetical protein
VLPLLLRALAVVAVYLFFAHVVDLPGDDGLGTGLLAFATLALGALVWGAVDGWRMRYGALAVAWVGAGILGAVAMSVLTQVPPGDDGFDWGVLGSDLVTSGPFLAVLVIAPALVAGAITYAVRSARTAQHS